MSDWIHVDNRACRACDGPVTDGICDACQADQAEIAEAEHEAARERYYEDLAGLRRDRAHLGAAMPWRRR